MSGFRWTGRSPKSCTKSTKPSADTRRGELGGLAGPLPGQAQVVDESACETQLGVGATINHVQRSACSGVHSDGAVQPNVFFANRKVCSRSKRCR